VEREKRDERAKSEKQEEINYRVVRNATGLGELEDMAEVETALTERLDEIETDKAKKENETTSRQVNGGFPRSGLAVA
jgi:hypothetical protein